MQSLKKKKTPLPCIFPGLKCFYWNICSNKKEKNVAFWKTKMGKTWAIDLILHSSVRNWDFPSVERLSQKFQVHQVDLGIPVLND